jgi:hypothetical protein
MRLTTPILSIVAIGFALQTPGGAQETAKRREDGARIEFYVVGRLQPALRYRVKSFRLVGQNSPELAARFNDLAAQGLDSGEYQYYLTPEKPPIGQRSDFDLSGRVQLYGAQSRLITLQMPTGSYIDGAIFMLNGRVLPPPDGGKDPVWIRFQHAVDHAQVVQAKLNVDGTFRIPTGLWFTGSVIVTVCRGGDVLFLDVVHFAGGQPERPLEFRLRENPL